MSKPHLLRKLRTQTLTHLAPSTVHGVGVFASVDIPRDTPPFKTRRPGERLVGLTPTDIDALPPHVAPRVRAFFPPDDDGVCWVSSFGLVGMDMTFYLNSSTTPNLELSGSDGRYMGFRTLRDVAAGEELTFSYQLEK